MSDVFSDNSPVVKMPFILLGYLTLHPKSIQASTVAGTLYVEDNLAAIVCEVNICSSRYTVHTCSSNMVMDEESVTMVEL